MLIASAPALPLLHLVRRTCMVKKKRVLAGKLLFVNGPTPICVRALMGSTGAPRKVGPHTGPYLTGKVKLRPKWNNVFAPPFSSAAGQLEPPHQEKKKRKREKKNLASLSNTPPRPQSFRSEHTHARRDGATSPRHELS